MTSKGLPLEVVEIIISFLRDADMKTLLACRETCWDFKFLIDKKTSLWSRVSLARAVKDEKVDICQLIVTNAKKDMNTMDGAGWTPLHWAAKLGLTHCAELLHA